MLLQFIYLSGFIQLADWSTATAERPDPLHRASHRREALPAALLGSCTWTAPPAAHLEIPAHAHPHLQKPEPRGAAKALLSHAKKIKAQFRRAPQEDGKTHQFADASINHAGRRDKITKEKVSVYTCVLTFSSH